MKEVKQFKKENGNTTYSNKELLGAIHIKLDRIDERLIQGDKALSSNTAWIGAYRWILGGIGITLMYILSLLLN